MTNSLAIRQQLLKPPPPPLNEEQVLLWDMNEEQRAMVIQLVRSLHAAHDRWLDVAVSWETKLADVQSELHRVQFEAAAVGPERREILELKTNFEQFVAGMQMMLGIDLRGLDAKAQFGCLLTAASNLYTETVQLRTGALSPRCSNCDMPHFTQDCDRP